MANITPQKDKDGVIIGYRIRVFRGRTADGKQLAPYSMIWNVPTGWTLKRAEKEARKQAALFEENCKLGNVATEKKSFSEYAEYVIDLKESTGIKPHTIKIYRDCLKRVNDVSVNGIGYIKLQDLRAEHLNLFYKSLAQNGVNKTTGGGLSAKYIYEHHAFISTVLSQAVDECLIPYNAAERAKPPKKPRHEAKFLEISDILRIIEALKNEPLKWQVIINLLIATGARRGEIAGLKWENCDLTNNQIYICSNLSYLPGKGVFEGTTKTDQNRTVAVADEVMELVKKWRYEQAAIYGGEKSLPMSSGYLFTMEEDLSKPCIPDTISKYLSRF